eukprot:Rhum_TRINITY_DN5137_c0_g1::Rhum_TRINITY_DN5137_c0_g1_i1::g.16519::m.16519
MLAALLLRLARRLERQLVERLAVIERTRRVAERNRVLRVVVVRRPRPLHGVGNLVDKLDDLLHCHVRHHHHVRNVALARQLPVLHERLGRARQHNSRRALVQHSLHAAVPQHGCEEACVRVALLHLLVQRLETALLEGVPEEDGGVSVARAHDGRVDRVQVLDLLRHVVEVLLPADDHAARHRAAEELVSRHAHRVNLLREVNLLELLHERQHQRVQRTVAVDEPLIAGEAEPRHHLHLGVHGVDGTLHGRADVGDEDGVPVRVLRQLLLEVLVVHLTRRRGADLAVLNLVVAARLEHGVVRVLRRVQDALRVHLTGAEDRVQVALRAARCDVAPVLVLRDLPEVGEEGKHVQLELAGVHRVVRLDERVAQVVDRVLHAVEDLLVVVVQVVRVPEVEARAVVQVLPVLLEHVADHLVVRQHVLPVHHHLEALLLHELAEAEVQALLGGQEDLVAVLVNVLQALQALLAHGLADRRHEVGELRGAADRHLHHLALRVPRLHDLRDVVRHGAGFVWKCACLSNEVQIL